MKALYGDSPYGYPAVGTTASVKSITRDDLAGFWNAHYGPQTSALVLTGDITETGGARPGRQILRRVEELGCRCGGFGA